MNALNQNLQTKNSETAKEQEGQKAHQAAGAKQAQAVTFLPKSDVVEREKAYYLFLEIPGVKKENVELQLEKNRLTITGKLGQSKHARALRSEYREGNYERGFTLGEGIDKTEITAELKDGLLEVTLPKKPEAEPVQISVQ